MYENLVAWLRDKNFEPICPCGDESICEGKDCAVLQAADAIEELSLELDEYTTAKREGRLLILPCKVGDVVYITGSKYRAGRWEKWVNTGRFRISDLEKLGKSVFLTREKAEAAMKEANDGN